MIRIDNSLAQWLYAFMKDAVPPSIHHGEQRRSLIQSLETQLNTPRHFEDLVDVLATMLSNPRYPTLNANQVAQLRAAVLSPLELATLKAQMQAQQTCCECREPLADSEIATIIRGNLLCWQCRMPARITCPDCRKPITIPGLEKTIMRAMRRHAPCNHGEAQDTAPERPSTIPSQPSLRLRSARDLPSTPPAPPSVGSSEGTNRFG